MKIIKNIKSFILIATLLLNYAAFAQHEISGKVIDKETNKPLVFAHISIDDTYMLSTTNASGEYIFENIKAGDYIFKISYIGYKNLIKKISISENTKLDFSLEISSILSEEVIISAIKAGKYTPVAVSNINKRQVEKINLGQDMPYIIKMLPSVVISSDAGAGVGYTSFRIRGTDITRINVTLNGIPLNDPESHGVFWVNMPDFSSSVDELQIQRGVGTSTNGAAAFGASMNINSLHLKPEAFAQINSTAGSFNTFKNNVSFGTGLLNNKWAFDGRLSNITSDGYIDRAFSKLKSFYFSGGYFGKTTFVEAIISSGKEKTYQAWNGVPKGLLETNRTYNSYTYENETDNYQQSHYQLHFTQQFTNKFHFSSSLFYVKGEGYYEQFKNDGKFSDYNLNNFTVGNDTITKTDLIRQKWLDNDFYGATFSFNYKINNLKAIVGGGWNHYEGGHFGEVIWMEWADNSSNNYRWYENTGTKTDFNVFGKVEYRLQEKLNLFGDLQLRRINFEIDGIHDDLNNISQNHQFNFFNPKAGIFFNLNTNNDFFASVAVANREPSRSNYRDADANYEPKPEKLIDYELGYAFKHRKINLQANAFYMDYTDQLVLTGKINDVGAAIMANVPESFRYGLELNTGLNIRKNLQWNITAAYSQNKIIDFVDYTDNWNDGVQVVDRIGKTNLSFSPEFVAGSVIDFSPIKFFTFSLLSKYVSRQYIDNTSDKSRSLNSYFVNDISIRTNFSTNFMKEIEIKLLVNNIFNEKYETNAWVYKYYLDNELQTLDGYFPQAGTNFLVGVSLKF